MMKAFPANNALLTEGSCLMFLLSVQTLTCWVLQRPPWRSGGVFSSLARLIFGWYCSRMRNCWSQNSLIPYIAFGQAFAILLSSTFSRCTRSKINNSTQPRYQSQGRLLAGPWLAPCRTYHARFSPKRHVFSYPYLQVLFRVGKASCNSNLLGIETPAIWTLLSISAQDHLFRDRSSLSLDEKLTAYLHTENVDSQDVPHVFLSTAPRVLGYSFNPVSFWYLYDKSFSLRYMILEVNNTFDERRMYLLERTEDTEETDRPAALPTPFKKSWPKDFHVSPFNSRKGSYSLIARNPDFCESQTPQIDNTITLRSSTGHAKLVARLQTTSAAMSLDSMGPVKTGLFISSWVWVGFLTFPRILKEAFRLFFGLGLHIWYRPEVLDKSISRTETHREANIAVMFDDFLTRQCDRQAKPINYTRTLATGSRFRRLGPDPSTSQILDFKVHSPLFYVKYAVDESHIRSSRLAPQSARTFSVQGTHADTDLHILLCQTSDKLVSGMSSRRLSGRIRALGYLLLGSFQDIRFQLSMDMSTNEEFEALLHRAPFGWRLLAYLRSIARDQSTDLRLHPLDAFAYALWRKSLPGFQSNVTASLAAQRAEMYRAAVTDHLLSDICTFGSIGMLDFLIVSVRLLTSCFSFAMLEKGFSRPSWQVYDLVAVICAFYTLSQL